MSPRSSTLAVALTGLLGGCTEKSPEPAEAAAGPRAVAAEARAGQTASRTAAGAQEPATASFRAWDAACDNTRRCTLFGYPTAGTEAWGFVRIERGAEPDAQPVVMLAVGESPGESTGAQRPRRLEASIDGGRAVRLTATDEDAPYYAGVLEGALAQAFVKTLRNGRTVRLTVEGMRPGGVSLDGAAAAMLWMDERQGRAGATQAASPPPVVKAVQPVGGKLTGPPALYRWRARSRCAVEEVGVGGNNDEIIGTRLTDKLVLWEIPCGSGAYNYTTAFYYGDEAGGGLRPVALHADEVEGDWPAHHLVNAGLEGGRIEAFSKARGIGDCGALQAWTWDGRDFVLTDHRSMPRCQGVVVDHWPVLHRTIAR